MVPQQGMMQQLPMGPGGPMGPLPGMHPGMMEQQQYGMHPGMYMGGPGGQQGMRMMSPHPSMQQQQQQLQMAGPGRPPMGPQGAMMQQQGYHNMAPHMMAPNQYPNQQNPNMPPQGMMSQQQQQQQQQQKLQQHQQQQLQQQQQQLMTAQQHQQGYEQVKLAEQKMARGPTESPTFPTTLSPNVVETTKTESSESLAESKPSSAVPISEPSTQSGNLLTYNLLQIC